MRGRPRSTVKVYALVALSGVFLVGTFYVLGLRPLSVELHTLYALRSAHALEDIVAAVDGVVAHHHDLTARIANDPDLRHLHTAHNAGALTHAALAAEGRPRLTTTLSAHADMLGLAHHAPDGRRLLGVGAEVPAPPARVCMNTVQPGQRASRGPFTEPDGRRLVYCSPIRDPERGAIGFVVTLLSDRRLEALVADLNDPATAYLLTSPSGTIVFGPDPATHAAHIAAAGRHLSGERIPPNDGDGDRSADFLIRSSATLMPGLQVHQIVDQRLYFAPVRQRNLWLGLSMLGVSVLVLGLTLMILRPLMARLFNEQRLLERARRDALTGLLNQGEMHDELAREIERARRYRRPLSLIMFDVDRFKRINDHYGHPVGDEVLHGIGAFCGTLSRHSDAWARYGGDEFLAILPETDATAAERLAERLRTHLDTGAMTTSAGPIGVTISAGVVTWRPGMPPIGKDELIATADRGLYDSKAAGRNCVTIARLATLRPAA